MINQWQLLFLQKLDFSSEIGELKIRLQAMEQQAQLRDGKHFFL
jgi:hypothetical protein